MTDLLTRRAFLASLAAAGVAAGLPLPVGWPLEAGPIGWRAWSQAVILHPDWMKSSIAHMKRNSVAPTVDGNYLLLANPQTFEDLREMAS